jgi:hypothetical protein
MNVAATSDELRIGAVSETRRERCRRSPHRLQVPRRRRCDLLLGLLVAVALHLALGCCGWWFPPVKPAPVEALAEAARPVELEVVSEPEPPPAFDVPPEIGEYAAAGGETTVEPTIVPLDLLRAQAGTITLQYARFSPTLAAAAAVSGSMAARCATQAGACACPFSSWPISTRRRSFCRSRCRNTRPRC